MKTKLLLVLVFCTFNLFSQTNLVPNGGFETWTNSTTLSNWTMKNNVTQSTSYTEGSKSVQLSITNSTTRPEIIAQVPMTAGTTYTVKFKYKYVSANYSGQHPIALNISKNGSATTLSSSTFASDNNWTLKETTFTPDQNLSYDLSISTTTFDAAAFNILIDDVQVYIQGTEQYTLIPDLNFEKKLIALGIDSGATDGKVLTNSINKLTSLSVNSSSIADLKGIQDFIALQSLICYSNQLTTLDISKNVALIHLECDSNQLTSLDVSKNIALTHLECQNNKLTALDVTKNVSLSLLFCYSNQLTTLDVSKNVALISLSCNSNQLPALDVSKNVALTYLDCNTNKLTSLNLKNGKNTLLTNANINLTSNPNLNCIAVDNVTYSNTNWTTKKDSFAYFSPLDCSLVTKIPDAAFEDKLIALGIDTDGKNGLVATASIASLTSLNISNSSITNLAGIEAFTALTTLDCSGNLLTKLDLSKNTAIAALNSVNNPNLICIQVADVTAAAKWTTTKDATTSFNLDCTPYTLIPDAKFEDKLIALGIDKDGKNGKVATASIASLTYLNVSSSSITDLTGIQDFVALKTLTCHSNQLTALDVSKNVALQVLYCYSNQLTSLDISKNITLTYLESESNKLTTLDISKNLALTDLYCYSNQLTALDVSKNVALKTIYCDSNKLSSFDVSKNVALATLSCYSNQLAALDVSKNTALTYLDCYSNQLTALDVSKNVALKTLSCNNNQLTILDVSKNQSLATLYCYSNKLSSLNLKNGKNTLLTNANINLTGNANLNCILVDDVAYSNTNWATKKDSFAYFSPLDCSLVTKITDAAFEDKLIALGIDTDGKNGIIATASIASLTSLNVSNSSITNLAGIEAFTALTTLDCSGNLLTKLDLSKNTAVTTLNSVNNPNLICIQVADVTAAAKWTTTKDATTSFNIDCTPYTLIPDAKFEDKLIALGIDKDGKNGKVATASIASVTSLSVSSSSITDLTGIQDFVALKTLTCYSNQLTALDVSKNVALTRLECDYNKLTALDVSRNLVLTNLYCYNNQLTTLDVSKNTVLGNLQCTSNQLTSLDISKNLALNYLDCRSNKLTSLNLKNGKNTLLLNANINLTNNPNLNCILVDDVTYSNTNWVTKKDATASFNSVECVQLSLPANNFTVESKGETCTDSKNGEISITATASYAYKAIINSNTFTFTNNNLKVTNLAPGTYTISITIPGETFEQNFTVVIPKAATITGRSSISSNKVEVEITEGTAPFIVFVDGIEQFETSESSFSIETKKGGLVEVKTAKACEGIYATTAEGLEGAVTAYPNPTSGSFEVQLQTSRKEIAIALYTLDGHLISNKTYTVENGTAKLSLENQPTGVYVAKIMSDTPDYLKIIKN